MVTDLVQTGWSKGNLAQLSFTVARPLAGQEFGLTNKQQADCYKELPFLGNGWIKRVASCSLPNLVQRH